MYKYLYQIEPKNKRRLDELSANYQTCKSQLTEAENALWNHIRPFVEYVTGGSIRDIKKLIEIRQHMLSIQDSFLFRRVTDALEGHHTGYEKISGWVAADTLSAIDINVAQCEARKVYLTDANAKLTRYLDTYISNREGWWDIDMLTAIIEVIPDCPARYRLMKDREARYTILEREKQQNMEG